MFAHHMVIHTAKGSCSFFSSYVPQRFCSGQPKWPPRRSKWSPRMSDFQWVEAEDLKAHEKVPTCPLMRAAIINRRIAETHERIFKRLGYWLPKALEMNPLRASLGNVPPPHVCAHEDDELVFVTPQQPDDPPPHHLTAHADPYQ